MRACTHLSHLQPISQEKPSSNASQPPIRRLFRWQSIYRLDCFRHIGYTVSPVVPALSPPLPFLLPRPGFSFFACPSRVSSGPSDQDISILQQPLGKSAIKARDTPTLTPQGQHLLKLPTYLRQRYSTMSSVRTRRQVAAGEETPSKIRPASSEPQQIVMNGNGSAHHSDAAAGDERENIFLFWPNIIGMASIETKGLLRHIR